ncbi:hypothetical protein [Neoaquamicrobium sediminum]|uniref:hypothetical protein n=1 Tax=Neoaquamicrobium sediminum TaxID=1849104 RepID=UPI003BABA666
MAPQWQPRGRPLVHNLDSLTRAVEECDRQFREYAGSGRGRDKVGDEAISRISFREAKSLYVTNAKSRVEIARASGLAIKRLISNRDNQPVHFATLTPVEFVVPVDQAHRFDIGLLREWTTRQLWGFDYVGTVEAAYYAITEVQAVAPRPAVSWHVHAIIYGATSERVELLEQSINAHHHALLGKDAARISRLEVADALARVYYMLKPCQSRHRTWKRIRKTGGVAMDQNKDAIRPGEYAKMVGVFADRTFDSFLVAGGSAGQFWPEILERTRRRLRQRYNAEQARIQQLIDGH